MQGSRCVTGSQCGSPQHPRRQAASRNLVAACQCGSTAALQPWRTRSTSKQSRDRMFFPTTESRHDCLLSDDDTVPQGSQAASSASSRPSLHTSCTQNTRAGALSIRPLPFLPWFSLSRSFQETSRRERERFAGIRVPPPPATLSPPDGHGGWANRLAPGPASVPPSLSPRSLLNGSFKFSPPSSLATPPLNLWPGPAQHRHWRARLPGAAQKAATHGAPSESASLRAWGDSELLG